MEAEYAETLAYFRENANDLRKIAMESRYVENKFNQIMMPFVYTLTRALRIWTVPLRTHFDYYNSLYHETCMIDNPLYNPDSQLGDHMCESCTDNVNVTSYSEASIKDGLPPKHLYFISPIIYKNLGVNFTFEEFQDKLTANPLTREIQYGIKTNIDWATTFTNFLSPQTLDRLTNQPDFFYSFDSKLVSTSQVLKQIFPRPPVFPDDYGFHVRKHLFMSGPTTPAFEIPFVDMAVLTWLSQGLGSAQLSLEPIKSCRDECKTLTVDIDAGDILVYNPNLYTVTSDSGRQGEAVNIQFLGQVGYLGQDEPLRDGDSDDDEGGETGEHPDSETSAESDTENPQSDQDPSSETDTPPEFEKTSESHSDEGSDAESKSDL